MPHPPILIESWFPIEAIGAESKRERGASSALPPLYFLHVWWARRPLIASRAAILASVLPQWSAEWPKALQEKFKDEVSYHQWFLRCCGILGDPVDARKLIDLEKSTGIRTSKKKYGYDRAFTQNPAVEDMQTIRQLLEFAWKGQDLSVLDPFSGGGSIPFEALRLGFNTYASDLNPVAAVTLKATLDYPMRFGVELADSILKWGNRWQEIATPKLKPFYRAPEGEPERTIYMWARSVACPTTGKPIPLSPNWWISSQQPLLAVRMIAEPHMETPCFEIVKGAKIRTINPSKGTISRGTARSPWTGETIEGDYIKSEAQFGRMGEILYCIEVDTGNGREYWPPKDLDYRNIEKAEKYLEKAKPTWIANNIVPIEPFPEGNDNRPINYGMPTWADFFSPRQLITTAVYMEALEDIKREIDGFETFEKAEAIKIYLALAFNKCVNYNSRLSSWHSSRKIIRSVFDRHDYGFKWSYTEFNGAGGFLKWGIDQVVDAYRGIANLASPLQNSLFSEESRKSKVIDIGCRSAARLSHLPAGSIHNITVDPPYYDNVMYAELADFFYVWLKRSVGHLFPEFFTDELTNKDDEAVANPARFAGMGKKKNLLAEQDYERKMAAAFREMHRVLRDDGVLTVMFTHKRVEAWDTLASALIGAGFVIKASWPVHTESEHSLHQAKKNAAASTILLACRKRENASGEAVWWEDIQDQVRRTARQKAQEFSQQGIHGVDLYLSTFGPTLSILSQHWPVLTSEVDAKTGQPKPLRPEAALNLAREEVVRLRKQGLLRGREVDFDPATDWYLMAWDAFHAEQFPYDEGRKLAMALGVELDDLMKSKRLAAKKGQYIVLQTPVERRKKGMVDEDLMLFTEWIDAAHTAMMVYAEDGAGACDAFLQRSGLKHDATFKAVLQAMLNAIPRTRIQGKFARPEAEVLENMRLAFYDDLQAPVEEEPEMPQAVQMGLWDEAEEDEEKAEDDQVDIEYE